MTSFIHSSLNTARQFFSPQQPEKKQSSAKENLLKPQTLIKIQISQTPSSTVEIENPVSISIAGALDELSKAVERTYWHAVKKVTKAARNITIPTLLTVSASLGYDAIYLQNKGYKNDFLQFMHNNLQTIKFTINGAQHRHATPIFLNLITKTLTSSHKNIGYGISEEKAHTFYQNWGKFLTENKGYIFGASIAMTLVSYGVFRSIIQSANSSIESLSPVQKDNELDQK